GQAELRGHLGPSPAGQTQVVGRGIQTLPPREGYEPVWVSLHLGWNQNYEKRLPRASGAVANLAEKFAGQPVSFLDRWMGLERDDGLELFKGVGSAQSKKTFHPVHSIPQEHV